MKAEAELASLYRERAIARAWAARRDPKKKSRRFRRLEARRRPGARAAHCPRPDMSLLAHSVVALCFPQLLDIFRRQLRSIDLQRELVELAGETEWHLVVIGHRRASVGADVKVLV